MTNDPPGLAKKPRDLRAIAPWAPLLFVAYLFLYIGVDITSGRSDDPAILGYGFLALFGVGFVATLVVHARRRPMGLVCFGLAVLEGAFLGGCYVREYIALTFPMILIAGVTTGGLCAAALLFRGLAQARPVPSDRKTA